MSEIVTSDKSKRLIYFVGHKKQEKSALITKVCKNYETLSTLYKGEFVTRTLSNLYNLHAVRGKRNEKEELIFDTSMSGPHHYFGWIDPRKYHTIEFNRTHTFPLYREYDICVPLKSPKMLIPQSKIVVLENYNLYSGNRISDEKRNELQNKYGLKYEDKQYAYISENKMLIDDSLFESPGILELENEQIIFPVIKDAYNYDLAPFRAQIVPNNEPFAFNQELIEKCEHAQHKLRVVTYNYGENYVRDYLMRGSGIFIERHEFIQAITPVNNNCGGYVILGRELKAHKEPQLELIAVTIPFGYTLLVEVGAIHGDSTLTGLYMMAMTGNHNAMKTADTVFMKHNSGKNVECITEPNLPTISTLSGNNFLLTSDKLSLSDLKQLDRKEKSNIMKSLGFIERLYWEPVILTGTPNLGWTKTLGKSLP
jgi:hypothetical protein